MPLVFNRFVLGLFDVLGFEARFADIGLEGILRKYLQLVRLVDARTEHMQVLFGDMNFSESAYWSAEGHAFVFSRIYGAYASDSLLVWANADFPPARYPDALDVPAEELAHRREDAAEGWKYHPIPCDNFLDFCSELICHGLELGLPLRGGLAMGECVLHVDKRVFLGEPLIHAARMESSQRLIGASYTTSFFSQIVPRRFLLPFHEHLKQPPLPIFQGNVLDWPRHWRRTRRADPRSVVESLNKLEAARVYYDTTTRMIEASNAVSDRYEDPANTEIRRVYPQFSADALKLDVRAVRTAVRGGEDANAPDRPRR